MKIQQENIHEYSKIRKIHEHFLLWTIPIIRYYTGPAKELTTRFFLQNTLNLNSKTEAWKCLKVARSLTFAI